MDRTTTQSANRTSGIQPGAILAGAFVFIVSIGAATLAFSALNQNGQSIGETTPRAESSERGIGPGLGDGGSHVANLRAARNRLPAVSGNDLLAALAAFAKPGADSAACARAFGDEPSEVVVTDAATQKTSSAPVSMLVPVAEIRTATVPVVETKTPAAPAPAIETPAPAAAPEVEPSFLEAGLSVLEDTAASARARHEAFDGIRGALTSNADLRRAAALIGSTGNLPLEWKIAHRLEEITGEAFGLDAQSWATHLAR